LDNGSELTADIVLLSAGIKPNSNLAFKSGIDIGQFDGVITDEYQRVLKNGVPVENVFALGDCVESRNFITGKLMVSALASTALIQSHTVVENILGKPSQTTDFINPTITMLAGLQVGSVGLTSHTLNKEGLNYRSAKSMGKSHSRYIPGWKELHFKFLVKDSRLIGAQIIGEEDVKERINLLTLIIKENIEIKTILVTERAYTPPLALLMDPMNKALKNLIN
jgi:NADH oxidase (H2O2-forming)